ncbi:MAG: glycosyltransferase family 39 protein [Saprospiraceae bacterium]|nr:glycosyltransferase family 39 protein [Saprospiraceae bacterium]
MKNKRWHKYLIFVLFCGAIYFPLFLHLDWQPINNWDESLFAMRAAYMAEEGKYIHDYSYWVEDGMRHRSSKPPFTTWLQVASIKALGINELALRLPIALCALGTVLLFPWFARKNLGDVNIGYCAGFVLVTTMGYVREHAARTGDQDAALGLYMLAGAMAFYQYLEATESRQRLGWLAMLTVSTIAAVMTKYAFGLLFFPAFLIYAIYKKQLRNLISSGSVWLAGLLVLASVGSWLWYVDRQLPGFIERAFFHEMANRYTTTYTGHDHPFEYYFVNFWNKKYFLPWLLLLPIPLAQLFTKQPSRLRDITVLLFLCVTIQLLFVSSSGTKTDHYEVVSYPPMALLAGIGLYQVIQAVVHFWKGGTHRPAVVGAVFLCCLFLAVQPYDRVIAKVYKPNTDDRTMSYGYFLRKLQKTKPEFKHFTVLAPIYTGQVNYYAGLLNRKKGYDIHMNEFPLLVAEGDTVVACESKMIEPLMSNFELKAIESEGKCFLAIVKCRRSEPSTDWQKSGKSN